MMMRKYLYSLHSPFGRVGAPVVMTAEQATAQNDTLWAAGALERWGRGGVIDALTDELPAVTSDPAAAYRAALIRVRGAVAAYEYILVLLAERGTLEGIDRAVDCEVDLMTALGWLSARYPELDSANQADSQHILTDLTNVCCADGPAGRAAAIDVAIQRIRLSAQRIATTLTLLWHRAPVRQPAQTIETAA